MTGYTKLFASLVHSTIWREPDHVRLVWITMLAICDRNGVVEASLPGLADASRVTIEQCEEAIQRLMSPDKYSRSQEHEGRRVEVTDGGWLLLNYEKYRLKLSKEQARENNRRRQAEWRERQRNAKRNADNGTATKNNPIAEADPEAEADPKADQNKPRQNGVDVEFEFFWKHVLKKVGKLEAKRKFKIARKDKTWPGVERVVEVLVALQNTHAWSKEGRQYQPGPAKWLHAGGWNDEIAADGQATLDVIAEYERQEAAEREGVIDAECE